MFYLSCVCYAFVSVCLYVPCGHLFPIGILGQVWYLIVFIPDLCTLTYFQSKSINFFFLFLEERLLYKYLFTLICKKSYFNVPFLADQKKIKLIKKTSFEHDWTVRLSQFSLENQHLFSGFSIKINCPESNNRKQLLVVISPK